MTEEVKYRLLWQIGIIISIFLYSSGISSIYIFFRKVVFKKYRTIILTYHRVRDDGKYPDITVTSQNFDKQLIYLREHFDVIPLLEAVKSSQNGRPQKNDRASITFDDGYKDNYSKAFSVLKHQQIPATIFLISDQVGKSDDMLNIKEINSMKSTVQNSISKSYYNQKYHCLLIRRENEGITMALQNSNSRKPATSLLSQLKMEQLKKVMTSMN